VRKLFVLLASVLFISFCGTSNTFAASECTNNTCPLKEPAAESVKEDANIKSINNFFNTFAKYQNKHNIVALKALYSDDYVNGDGYDKQQLFNLMQKTFDNYPDITNEYSIEEIIVNANYAMIYVKQKTQATTKVASKITNDNGKYNSTLKYIMYIKKEAKSWKIYSEETTYEYSSLAYGMAKDVKTKLNAPQKVLNNSEYSAGLEIDIPAEYTAIASINSTQIVDGFDMQGESFRQVALDKGYLERILKANNSNNNEAVVVSVGFTKQNTDMFKKPKIELSGLLMLMKRVDIIPQTSNHTEKKDSKSANK